MTPRALIGPVGFGGAPFADWVAAVRAVGGTPTAWPFSTGLYANLYGRPAARYTTQQYASLANAGRLPDVTQPMETTANNQYIYVVANKGVADDAPATMNWIQRAANEAFSAGDAAAAAVGLPSLNAIENFLKSAGEDILILVAVGGVAWYLINRRS
jgi:hypothetical protein